MSRGIGAMARLVLEDEETVIYEYGNMNLNIPEFENKDHVMDGLITIHKSCFQEPEIHEKLKKMPSGRKRLVTKRIPVSVDYPSMIKEGKIEIQNSRFCWQTVAEKDIDIMACSILFKLFYAYQEESKIPEYISIFK